MTIDFILDEIYQKRVIEPICKKLIFKRLLQRLTSGCVFSANGKLIRQRNGCAIGGNFSGTMAGICMTKCMRDIIKPLNLPFFKLYVDDGYCRQKIEENGNSVLNALNNFHPRLKFTVEEEPSRFLDSKIILNASRSISTEAFKKPNKYPQHWSSQVPRRYKKNAIICDLHRTFAISDNFECEIAKIKERYLHAGYPAGFIHHVIKEFRFTRQECIIPKNFFDIPEKEKPTIRIRLPFCKSNENLTRTFLKKIRSFIGDSVSIFIIWNTSKIRSLFSLKDKNLHPQCVIYEGTCSCGTKYVGETDRCIHLRTSEHENIKKNSEPAKHLKAHRDHSFIWKVIAHAPRDDNKRKILEALYVAKFKPGLNEQVMSKRLKLFPNGLT